MFRCTLYLRIFIFGISTYNVCVVRKFCFSIGMTKFSFLYRSSVSHLMFVNFKTDYLIFKNRLIFSINFATKTLLRGPCLKSTFFMYLWSWTYVDFSRNNRLSVVLVGHFGSQVPRRRPCQFAKLNVADSYNVPLCWLRWYSPQHILRPWHYPHLRYGGMYENIVGYFRLVWQFIHLSYVLCG